MIAFATQGRESDKKGTGQERCEKSGKWNSSGRAKVEEGYTTKADLMAP